MRMMKMKNTERFSNRVKDYLLYRPNYPRAIISFLNQQVGLNSRWIVADVGSGTGISSEMFLENGNKVYGVEPNEEMRKAAEEIFRGNKNFISVDATAENTSLPDQSINLIVAGQAFHWFDRTKTKEEFQRIALPGAFLVLMWNDRDLEKPFHQAYEELLKEFTIDYQRVNFRNVEAEIIGDFYAPFSFHVQSYVHSQIFDFESLKGRLLSTSYAPLEGHPSYSPMIVRLKEIFDQFQTDSKITFDYKCNVYYGQIK